MKKLMFTALFCLMTTIVWAEGSCLMVTTVDSKEKTDYRKGDVIVVYPISKCQEKILSKTMVAVKLPDKDYDIAKEKYEKTLYDGDVIKEVREFGIDLEKVAIEKKISLTLNKETTLNNVEVTEVEDDKKIIAITVDR